MKQILFFTLLAATVFFTSCNPKVRTSILNSYGALNSEAEVITFSLSEDFPEGGEVLGNLKIGDTGFSTNCSYEVVINMAKLEARKIGGNAIKITSYKPPTTLGSSCHQIEAKIVKLDAETIANPAKLQESTDAVSDEPFATLNIYRYPGAGSLVGYNLHLGDSIICRVKNNYKETIRIEKEGEYLLWAKTEARAEVPIELENGRTYYLRCGIKLGVMVGQPTMEFVSPRMGKAEFESFDAKN